MGRGWVGDARSRTLGLVELAVAPCVAELSGAVARGTHRTGVVWKYDPRRDVVDRARSPKCGTPHEVRRIRVAPLAESRLVSKTDLQPDTSTQTRQPTGERWDLTTPPLSIASPPLRVGRPKDRESVDPKLLPSTTSNAPLASVVNGTPKAHEISPASLTLDPRFDSIVNEGGDQAGKPMPLATDMAEVNRADSQSTTGLPVKTQDIKTPADVTTQRRDRALAADRRLRPDRSILTERTTPDSRVGLAVRATRDGTSLCESRQICGRQRGSAKPTGGRPSAGGEGGRAAIRLRWLRQSPDSRLLPSRAMGLAALGDRGGIRLSVKYRRSTNRGSTRPVLAGAADRRECRQRAGRRACARLAGPPPGRRRPLGRRHRPLRRRHARQGRRRLHGPLPAGRDLLRRVRLLGGRHRADRPGPARPTWGPATPTRTASTPRRWARGSTS